MDEVAVNGSTAGAADSAGGASCGFGGGSGAPDAVYEYVATGTGTYDVATHDATFPVYLFVRNHSCGEAETELGCVDSPADATLAVSLVAGQHVAIVVDGSTANGGDFTLTVARRQPDLVIRSLSVPEQATAGGDLDVEAELENIGSAPAGPFSVEFFWARDTTLADRLGTGVTRCAVDGLGPHERTMCRPLNRLSVPLVAASSYVVGARVDDTDAVAERREDNNTAAAPAAMQVLGAELQHELYRARDGTAYQLVYAVPSALATAADRFRITTLAAVESGTASCATGSTQPGSLARAVAGAATPPLLADVVRTGILRPNDAAQVVFDPAAGGRLLLGTGATATAVCMRPERCAGSAAALAPLGATSGGIPGACLASGIPGATCNDAPVPAAIAFSGPPGAGCAAEAEVTAETQICAVEPSDGFVLHPGEAVVFVYAPGRGPLEAAVAGFGLSGAAGAGGCAADRVVAARALAASSGAQPLLALAGTVSDIDPQALGGLAVSPDGRHLYATSQDISALAVFNTVPIAGALSLVEVERQGQNGVDGLSGAGAVTISPDGAHVYVAGTDSVAVFRRDLDSGRLVFAQLRRNGVGGVQGLQAVNTLIISPDGAHLYAAGFSALAVFRRDPTTGALTFVEAERNGDADVEGYTGVTGAAISPDGAYVYAVGGADPAVLVFARDAASGRLSFVAAQREGSAGISGLGMPFRVAISPDGAHLYVIPTPPSDNAVVALRRDPDTGLATTVGTFSASGAAGLHFEAFLDVVVSPDGASVYVGGNASDDAHVPARGALAVFRRDRITGGLQPVLTDLDAVRAGELPGTLQVAPDGSGLYVPTQVAGRVSVAPAAGALLFLTETDGHLEAAAQYRGQPPPLAGVLLSRDGTEAYRVTRLLTATELRRFRRDAAGGGLQLAQVLPIEISGLGELRLEQSSLDGTSLYGGDGNQLVSFHRAGGTADVAAQQMFAPAELGNVSIGHFVLTADGRYLYVGFCDFGPGQGGLLILARAGDGTLAMHGVVRQSDEGFSALSCPTGLALGPDEQRLYVATAGGAVLVLDRDPAAGALSVAAVHTDLQVTSAIAVSADERSIYVGGAFGASVALYTRDPIGGALTFAGLQPPGVTGSGQAAQTAVSPDGAVVFFVDSSEDFGLAAYERDPASGALTTQQVIPYLDGVQLSPDGAFLYTTRVTDGATLIYAVAD